MSSTFLLLDIRRYVAGWHGQGHEDRRGGRSQKYGEHFWLTNVRDPGT